MSDAFEHFLVTRFNVRSHWFKDRSRNFQHRDIPRIDKQWLPDRFQLFDKFCYPSVKSQINQNFTWLVFFDHETPREFRELVDRYSNWSCFQAVYTDLWDDATCWKHIESRLDSSTDFVITSRLDNDDAIAKNYIELVQRQFNKQSLEFITFTRGYQLSHGSLHLIKWRRNHFESLIVERAKKLTLFRFDHNKIYENGPVREIDDGRVWCEVIHGRNLSNRSWGTWRVRRDELHRSFNILDPFPAESTKDIFLSNMNSVYRRRIMKSYYLVRRVFGQLRRRLGLVRHDKR